MRFCLNCKTEPRKPHPNSKYCKKCSDYFRKSPRRFLTKDKVEIIKELAGHVPKEVIADYLGISTNYLKPKVLGISFNYYNIYKKDPNLVSKVCKYYEKHGKVKTQKEFPNIKVRSIVERYKNFKPRQTRWKNEQLIELLRMAGLISFDAQAKFFKRPNAHRGSIQKKWVNLNGSPTLINGMFKSVVKHIVTKKAPYIKLKTGQYILLWVDMEKCLRDWVPDFIKEAIDTMADFQRMLFGSYPRRSVLMMIKKREI